MTGTALLDLKGYTGFPGNASFTPDGSRIVISSGGAAQICDARTGQELKGKPIPPTPATGRISPDGRWFALTGAWPESADQYNNTGWALIRDPGRSEADYRLGLRLAMAACRLESDNGLFLNTLGVAQYRCGLVAEALATLTRTNDLNKGKQPSDLAFLALAQHRLGQSDRARVSLARLRA